MSNENVSFLDFLFFKKIKDETVMCKMVTCVYHPPENHSDANYYIKSKTKFAQEALASNSKVISNFKKTV